MIESPTSISWSREPFRYVGGNPALDLINTVDWTARGLENDRLGDYPRFTRWAEGAGVISPGEGQALRRSGGQRKDEAEAALDDARAIRGLLRQMFEAVAKGRSAPGEAATAAFNRLLSDALGRLRVDVRRPSRGAVLAHWRWEGMPAAPGSPLWPTLQSAAALLTSDEAGQVCICPGDACGWMFVDRSRNRLRRWCEMETCGTRAKSRRRAQRARGRPKQRR